MKLRYIELNIGRIFNRLAPENVTASHTLQQYHSTWWNERTVIIRQYFAQAWIEEFDNLTKHFTNLRKSISKDGILKPVSCTSGPFRNPRDMAEANESLTFVPPEYHNNINEMIYTQPFGGSRIVIAKKLEIDTIPCVVHDYSNLFPDAPEVTRRNYMEWFGSGDYMFVDTPPHLRSVKHLHMDKGDKYEQLNLATRKAHARAAQVAKQKVKEKYG